MIVFCIVLISIAIVLYLTMDKNNAVLQLLGWVKKAKGDKVALNSIDTSKSKAIDHDIWDGLLSNNVDSIGKVNYEGFINSKRDFERYLDILSYNPPKQSDTEAYKISYWINAYNAYTVKLIIDNFPLASIKDLSNGVAILNSPWDIKFFEIGGVSFDLNTIEHQILRKEFSEPRIHFAINCASQSCPKLLDEAYTEASLEAQLERQTMSFINSPDKNDIDNNEAKLSKIFDWFAVDFEKNHGSVKQFIQKYVDVDIEPVSISFMEYDWSLNN